MKHRNFKRSTVTVTLLALLFFSCSTSRISSVFDKGEIGQDNFHESIHIDDAQDLPFIEVIINGKTARFLFDTGAPNVITQELADQLGLKQVNKMSVNGSGGHRIKKQPIVRVESIKIGQVEFINTNAVVLDLDNSSIFKCLDFDGIIGANLMKLCYWKMDLADDLLTFSDRLSSLVSSNSYDTIMFKTNNAGTPKISIEANKHRITDLTFDSGSSNHISASNKEVKNVLKGLSQKISNFIVGSTSYGVGGRANQDTTQYNLVEEVKVGSLQLNNIIVHFSKNGGRIGNKILKHYEVILDWNKKQILMDKQSDYIYDKINTFGYWTYAENRKLFVGELYNDTDAIKQLRRGDQVIMINNQSFENISDEELCTYLLSRGKNEANAELTKELTIKRED